MSGEAAEEFVRIMLNGTEVLVRLTGSAARSLASLLIEWNRNHQSALPDSPLYRLLRSGEPLQVVSLSKEEYAGFKEAVRSQFPYAPFQNAASPDEMIEIVLPESAMPLVSRIMKDIAPGKTDPDRDRNGMESKKKDSPSRRSSEDARDRSGLRKNSGPEQPEEDRVSVLSKLEANREYLRSVGSSKGKGRTRQRQVPQAR